MNDDDLVEQIRLGDEKAAEELIKRYYTSILCYCKRQCFNQEKAEDLTQETFLKLFKNLSGYKGKGKFKAYLYTIANHLCIDERRKMEIFPLENEEQIRDESDEMRRVEDRSEINYLLGTLSPEQREKEMFKYVRLLCLALVCAGAYWQRLCRGCMRPLLLAYGWLLFCFIFRQDRKGCRNMELFLLEHKKIWRRASTKVSVLLCFIYVVIAGGCNGIVLCHCAYEYAAGGNLRIRICIFRGNHIFGKYVWSPYLLITVPVLISALCLPLAAKGWSRRLRF